LAVTAQGRAVGFDAIDAIAARAVIDDALRLGSARTLGAAQRARMDPHRRWGGGLLPVVVVAGLSVAFGWRQGDYGFAAAVNKVLVAYVHDDTLYLDAGAYTRLTRMSRPEFDRVLEREYTTRILGLPFDDTLLPTPGWLRWLAGLDPAAAPVPEVPAGAPHRGAARHRGGVLHQRPGRVHRGGGRGAGRPGRC